MKKPHKEEPFIRVPTSALWGFFILSGLGSIIGCSIRALTGNERAPVLEILPRTARADHHRLRAPPTRLEGFVESLPSLDDAHELDTVAVRVLLA